MAQLSFDVEARGHPTINSELERIGVIDVQAAPLTITYGVLLPSP